MNFDTLADDINGFLDRQTRVLPPDILLLLKQNTERHISSLISGKVGELKVSMVLDTSVALQAIRYYAKGKISALLHMKKNPMFPIFAPPELAKEVEEKIELFAKKGLNKTKMLEAWAIIKSAITLAPLRHEYARKKALEIIGKRDKDDAAFVQVYVETGATGILTNDADYEQPEIRRFKLNKVAEAIGVFHRGVYSFFLLHDMFPIALQLLWQVMLTVAKAVLQFLMQIARLAAGAIAGAAEVVLDLLEGLPNNVKIAIGIATGIALIIAIAWKKSRDRIAEILGDLSDSLKPSLQKLTEWFKSVITSAVNLAKASGPYAIASLIVVGKFYENVTALTDELARMSAASA